MTRLDPLLLLLLTTFLLLFTHVLELRVNDDDDVKAKAELSEDAPTAAARANTDVLIFTKQIILINNVCMLQM